MHICNSVLILGAAVSMLALGQNDWPTYGRDLAGTRYSPLKQINPGNVSKLTRAWTYHMRAGNAPAQGPAEGNEVTVTGRGRGGRGGAGGGVPARVWEVSPLVVGGVMYWTTAYGHVVALEPETGKEL